MDRSFDSEVMNIEFILLIIATSDIITRFAANARFQMFYISKDCPAEAIAILVQMLVYAPSHRLHGQELLNNPFFKDIFDKSARRPCGRPISCLSSAVCLC